MKTATFIRWVGEDGPANQALYRMAPALDGYDLVIASGIRTRLAHGCFLFAADEHGEITDWTELSGVRDTTDHAEAMANAGYEIVEVQ